MDDRELLERFITSGDEAAFKVIVGRHGPMVLGVCRWSLGSDADAEDAFQATFLVLAEKARSVRKRRSLAAWLHGVALRTSLQMKAKMATRAKHEQEAAAMRAEAFGPEGSPRDLRPTLDKELARLPERLRLPITLCYLEGRTYEDGAETLGWGIEKFRKRLLKGRRLLKRRLLRHGVTASVLIVASLQTVEAARAAVTPGLIGSTAAVAAGVGTGNALGTGLVSKAVLDLAKGVSKAMWMTKMKAAAAVAIMLVLMGTGASVAVHEVLAGAGPEPAGYEAVHGGTGGSGPVLQPFAGPMVLAAADSAAPRPPARPMATLADPSAAPAPAREAVAQHHVGEILAGVVQSVQLPDSIAHVDNVDAGDVRFRFYVLLDEPWNGQEKVRFWCNERAVILLDGKASTFAEAVKVGRRVKVEHVRGPTPWVSASSAPAAGQDVSAAQPIRITEKQNGKTIKVAIGTLIDVVLEGDRAKTGWKLGTPIGNSVVPLEVGGNHGGTATPACEFTQADGASDPAIGTYLYRYKAVSEGTTTLNFAYIYPGGPGVIHRRRTVKIRPFHVKVEVLGHEREAGGSLRSASSPAPAAGAKVNPVPGSGGESLPADVVDRLGGGAG